jgi:predicted small lipoprotein YifL
MTQKRLKILSLIYIVALMGCGQSGALYLPGDPSTIQTTPSISSVIEGEADEDSDDAQDNEEEDE